MQSTFASISMNVMLTSQPILITVMQMLTVQMKMELLNVIAWMDSLVMESIALTTMNVLTQLTIIVKTSQWPTVGKSKPDALIHMDHMIAHVTLRSGLQVLIATTKKIIQIV